MPKQNDLPSPVTYGQKFYAKAAGMDVDLPEAITPEQKYLKAIAEGGGGTADAYTKAQTDALLDGKADLVDGKVPAAQLPSYVDDVAEYASTAAFPETGESGKIYISTDTNKTYRWGGSAYVEISESLALGETASTAYPGNKGKANADAIAAIKDGASIDSFADVETALVDKADKSTTYTKGQVDTALAAKLNTADVDTALSGTSTNPVQNKAVQAPIARLVDAGAKNLLNLGTGEINPSVITHGVTWTKETLTGAVVANGTSDSSGSYPTISKITLKPGTYFMRGGTQRIKLYEANSGTMDSGNGASFTVTDNTTQPIMIATVANKNTVFNDETIYPMVCLSEDYAVSPTFQPYAPSNRELYEMILALQNAQNGG